MASLLSAHGVEFERHDVLTDSAAAAFLAARSIKAVPVIVSGDEVIVGFDEARLQRLFGIVKAAPHAGPAWLASKYEAVFAALVRAVNQVGSERIEARFERRRLSIRTHIVHVITFAEGGYLALERGSFEGDDLRAALARADDAIEVDAVCRYAERVAGEIASFLRRARPDELGRTVRSHYGGEVTLFELLAIMVRHSTHHLLQLYWLLENEWGVAPDGRLTDADLDGITLPAELFDVP